MTPSGATLTVEWSALDSLFQALRSRNYTIVGPTVRQDAIVYDELQSIGDLPLGWSDEQEAGMYRLHPSNDGAVFGFTVGPHSWKKYLFPPSLTLFTARRSGNDLSIDHQDHHTIPQYAMFGVRPCEIAALTIQNAVFDGGQFGDPWYHAVRERSFIVAVNCATVGNTCFCASMDTGPRATNGYDLALTEVLESERHYTLVDVGSPRGQELMNDVSNREANESERVAGDTLLRDAAQQMKRSVNTEGIKELLTDRVDDPLWDEIARRCLSCANCTMVCPTCFCSTVVDRPDLSGANAERTRVWDSCFSLEYSYIHGGHVRPSVKARYRQWLTHKFSSWQDQFGSFGCVGCGRCITWCPVGIDLTQELSKFRDRPRLEGKGVVE
jgi:ferredoxin